jgi:hypothetical protein
MVADVGECFLSGPQQDHLRLCAQLAQFAVGIELDGDTAFLGDPFGLPT